MDNDLLLVWREKCNHNSKQTAKIHSIHWLPLSSTHLIASYYKLYNFLNSLTLNGKTFITPYTQEKGIQIKDGENREVLY